MSFKKRKSFAPVAPVPSTPKVNRSFANKVFDDLWRRRNERVRDGLNFIESLGFDVGQLVKADKVLLGVSFGGSAEARASFVRLCKLLLDEPDELSTRDDIDDELAALYAHIRVQTMEIRLIDERRHLAEEYPESGIIDELEASVKELRVRGADAAEEITRPPLGARRPDDVFRLLMSVAKSTLRSAADEFKAKQTSDRNRNNAKKSRESQKRSEILRIGAKVSKDKSQSAVPGIVQKRLKTEGIHASIRTIRDTLVKARIIDSPKNRK